MSFIFSTLLTIGLPLVAVPVLIHLINLRRQRRIEWAAMEFLLQSQKKHRTSILLKQLLLLLLRMAAIAIVTFMVAQPVLRSEWGGVLGQATSHHLVLLDDSYSMTDRVGNASAFDDANRVVQQIADQAAAEGGSHLFSLLRFSEAARLTAGSRPDLFRELVDEEFGEQLELLLGSRDASQTAAGPLRALEALFRLPKGDEDETLIVYLVSDFRELQWERAGDLRQQLLRIYGDGARLIFVDCADQAHDNVAVTKLQLGSGQPAAGVEMWMELTVANYSPKPLHGLAVQLSEDDHPRGAVEFQSIGARETSTRRFRVNFQTAGAHTITATLPADAVLVDNQRFFATEVPSVVPLLIIDGSTTGEDGRFVSTSLAPGGAVKTGWQPTIERASYLRRSEEIATYAAIFLLDVARLDSTEVQTLDEYVRAGGGVAFFLGEQTDRAHVNADWYRDGEGIFPVPLRLPTQWLPPAGEPSPDVVITDHPIFQVLAGERNSFLGQMLVDFYFALPADWQTSTQNTASAPPGRFAEPQVIAHLQSGAPLVVELHRGRGRVISFLSKASPEQTTRGQWNNWGNNPAFPVVINELARHLASHWRREPERLVGEPLRIAVDQSVYTTGFRFHIPGTANSSAAERSGDEAQVVPLDATADGGVLRAELAGASPSGLYGVELVRRDGRKELRRYAINVPNGEGDLRKVAPSDLASRLEGIRFEYHDASAFSKESTEIAGFQLADVFLYLLIAVLVIEQGIAYFLSYHPKPVQSKS